MLKVQFKPFYSCQVRIFNQGSCIGCLNGSYAPAYATSDMMAMYPSCGVGHARMVQLMAAAELPTRGVQLLPVLYALLVRCWVGYTIRIGGHVNLITEFHLTRPIHVEHHLGPLDGNLIILHGLYSRCGTQEGAPLH